MTNKAKQHGLTLPPEYEQVEQALASASTSPQ
jgi:hypothetical protein